MTKRYELIFFATYQGRSYCTRSFITNRISYPSDPFLIIRHYYSLLGSYNPGPRSLAGAVEALLGGKDTFPPFHRDMLVDDRVF